ncbi:hypothetical protein NECAME_06648 [Necator americanus]|uniref:Uncharacterized protein n=1 Tax=Necator americanus TaxID=51031 RepID=W2TT57_NECAM|nr:hypothetical protein NECAME_06648 [Necator americanus]ETN84844.1 hypothetical protein NECAME_06648 [Necator americanus]
MSALLEQERSSVRGHNGIGCTTDILWCTSRRYTPYQTCATRQSVNAFHNYLTSSSTHFSTSAPNSSDFEEFITTRRTTSEILGDFLQSEWEHYVRSPMGCDENSIMVYGTYLMFSGWGRSSDHLIDLKAPPNRGSAGFGTKRNEVLSPKDQCSGGFCFGKDLFWSRHTISSKPVRMIKASQESLLCCKKINGDVSLKK